MASLVVEGLGKELGGREVVRGLSLTVETGELVCLLGPSGCGKTTTLRIIAGFVAPDSGRITIGDRDVTADPPERRPTAMVFQSYALWPHMTVFKNVAFGLRLRRLPRDEVADRVAAALRMVNLTGAERRKPGRLSGGEQQRVALARALVLEPDLLLLDEPLSNLDAKLRVAVREDIREIQQRLGIATLFVTHDQDEALSISDRIAVMSEGRIEQFSTGAELYRRPATDFVAGFIGAMNSFSARVEDSALLVGAPPTTLPCPPGALAGVPDGDWEAAVRPENVRVVGAGAGGAPVELVKEVPHGHFDELVLRLTGSDISLRAYVSPDLDRDGPIGVTVSRVLLYREGKLAHECGTGRGASTASPAAPVATSTSASPDPSSSDPCAPVELTAAPASSSAQP